MGGFFFLFFSGGGGDTASQTMSVGPEDGWGGLQNLSSLSLFDVEE